MPHAPSTGSARAPSRILNMLASRNKTVQVVIIEPPHRPALELVADRLAHPWHRRLREDGLGAEGVGQGLLHVADDRPRTNPAITYDSNAFDFVTDLRNS
jgi:hypothetical protein